MHKLIYDHCKTLYCVFYNYGKWRVIYAIRHYNIAEVSFWTSLTDTRRDGTWLWESSMTIPDYTNWYPKRPNTVVNNVDDCMLYGGATYLTFWGDIACTTTAHAICEAHP